MRVRLFVGVALAVVFLGVALPGRVSAATALSLTLDATPHKVVGSRVVPGALPADDICGPSQVGDPYTTAMLEMRWHGSGGTGALHYDVYTAYEPMSDSDFTLVVRNTLATSYRFPMTNNDSDCGGGADQKYFKIVARDAAGRTTTQYGFANRTDIIQQDGTSLGVFSARPHKAGLWHTSQCTCFDGGTTMYSTVAGASVSYSLNLWHDERVALVMDENSNRGKVSVRVDNGTPTVLDTYSARGGRPVIVWQHHVKTDGQHTITITNLGTPGRSRVDVDSFIL